MTTMPDSDDKTMHICLATDDRYAMHCSVTIASILVNAAESDRLHFYIFNSNLSLENKNRLTALTRLKPCILEFKQMNLSDYDRYSLAEHAYISMTTYFRIGIASTLKHLDKALYLDCDLAITTSLASLYETDLTGYYGAMVIDLPAQSAVRVFSMKHHYYNSGVLLINCKIWRDEGLDLKMLEWVSQNAKAIKYADQDAINFISDGRIKTLDPKYNTFGYELNEMTDGDKPVIIHYVGSLKPWNPLSGLPVESEYFRYLKLTGWNQGKYLRFLKTVMLFATKWIGEGLKKVLRVVSPTLFRYLKRLYLKGRNK